MHSICLLLCRDCDHNDVLTLTSGSTDEGYGLNNNTTRETRLSESRVAVINEPAEIEKVTEQLLDGVVDLRNTVDTDREVQFSPGMYPESLFYTNGCCAIQSLTNLKTAVTHEVVKPHEHEIVQHKVYREINNYEYHHRIQPVYDLQILPPRHWILKPNGDGLEEISANDLPQHTGANRRWEIVQKHIPLGAETMPKYRTEPEIIERPRYTTEEGFERRETTIIYPPTIADMGDYKGLVQPVHFDHKTGKRWLGDMTTMDKLQKEIDNIRETGSLNMEALRKNLPKVPELSPSNSPLEVRKLSDTASWNT